MPPLRRTLNAEEKNEWFRVIRKGLDDLKKKI